MYPPNGGGAMAKRISPKGGLTPAQAKYVLQKMLDDRRITSADIDRCMHRMKNEIEELEQRLKSLRPSRSSRAAGVTPAPSASSRPARRRRPASSGALLASRQLQAEYIRTIKTFPERARKKYKEITKNKGREAALAAMKKDMRGKAAPARRRRARSKK